MTAILVSKSLLRQVATLMYQHGMPMRPTQIAKQIGCSRTTALRALELLGAQRTEDTPATYTLPDGAEVDAAIDRLKAAEAPNVTGITALIPRVGEARGNDYIVSSPEMTIPEIAETWNQNHQKYADAIGTMHIDEGIDPRKLATQLGQFAGAVAALSNALESISGRPDWMDELS